MTFRNTSSKVIAVTTHRERASERILEQRVQPENPASRNKLLALVLALAATLCACGGASEAPNGGPSRSGGPSASKSSNPWGGFKVGSFVNTKTTVSAQVMGRTTDTT